MSLGCFVGSFTVPSSTGNLAVTGIVDQFGSPFTPSIVFFFCNTSTADGTSGSSNANMPMNVLGVAISSMARGCIFDCDNFSGGVNGFSSSLCISVASGNTPTVTFAADFVSTSSGTFTLNFTTANASAFLISFLAVGGSDLTNVALKSFTAPTVTGNISETGVGFKPDAMVLIGGQGTGAPGGTSGLGFTSGTSNQVTNSTGFDGSSIGRYERTTEAYSEINGFAVLREATLVSLDVDGFTLNFTTVTASPNATILAFCMKGAQFSAGSFLQPTAPGNLSITGSAFQPTGLLVSSVLNISTTGLDRGNRICQQIGAASGTSNRASVYFGDNNAGVNSYDRTKVWRSDSDATSPSLQASADLVSFDSSGYTLNFAAADATAREGIYMIFGPQPAPPPQFLMGAIMV